MKKIIVYAASLILVGCAAENNEPVVDQPQEQVAVFNADSAKAKYNFQENFTGDELDTLMANFATYIYRRPSAAQWDTRFNPEFRQYYIDSRDTLELVYLHKADSRYYYYLLRDAKDKNGIQKRGVGGVFQMNDSLVFANFEELFNTRIFEDDRLVEIGFDFMEEISANGNANTFINDTSLIEWPDGTLFYSKEKFEWRFPE